ncbi:hypothetical protein BDW74DRAFT_87117 [Aspergillus multicolor]|uniref:uncharacterized protein n=1 Tax=Aspergillus multicolor TaxID=41759 RepID=UPI003CCD3E4C
MKVLRFIVLSSALFRRVLPQQQLQHWYGSESLYGVVPSISPYPSPGPGFRLLNRWVSSACFFDYSMWHGRSTRKAPSPRLHIGLD